MASTTNNGWTTPDDTGLVKDGALAIRTLGSAIDTSVGTGLLAWQSYSPTLSGGTSPVWANGNGTYDAKYCKVGKTVTVSIVFTLGSTTTKGNSSPIFTLPSGLPARLTGGYTPQMCRLTRSAVYYGIAVCDFSATTVRLYITNTASTYANVDAISSTVPGTWATGDTMSFQFTYETSA